MITYNKNENYCTMSPESILGCTYNYGCFLHDRHYRNERKVRLNRKDADKLLRDTIYKILKTSNVPFELRLRIIEWDINVLFFTSKSKLLIKFRKMIAKPWSRLYYYTVRLLASKYYIK
jgi:hypothetical protein